MRKIQDIKKALFFTSCSHAGKFFLDSLLDGHPNILGFNPTTMAKTVRKKVQEVSGLPGKELEDALVSYIEEAFRDNEWDRYVADEKETDSDSALIPDFRKVLHSYLEGGTSFTEKEILLLLYWSLYETVYGSCPPEGECVFFIDVHDGGEEENTLKWLLELGFEVTLIEAVRNPFSKLGSFFRMWKNDTIRPENLFRQLSYLGHETLNETERELPMLRYRFEDLKQYPKELLSMLCSRLGISWDDCLMEATFLGKDSTFTTTGGEKTKGFSLKPVWYPYDEYFDVYDRFRLNLLFYQRCRAYDYTYVPPERYPLSEQEMTALFEEPFRFEEQISFESEEERLRYRRELRLLAEKLCDMYHHEEDFPEAFCFGEYLKVER